MYLCYTYKFQYKYIVGSVVVYVQALTSSFQHFSASSAWLPITKSRGVINDKTESKSQPQNP